MPELIELPCLVDFITLQTVCPGGTYVKPKSLLHVEELPGFSTRALAAIDPAKYLNVQRMVREKVQTAGKMVVDKMRNSLSQYIRERGALEAGYIGSYSDDAPLTGTALRRGVRVRVQGGAMLVPGISRVWLKSSTAIPDLVVYVRDKDSQNVDEHVVALEAGVETELWLDYEGKKKEVDVYVEDERFTPYTGSTEGTSYFSDCNTCGGRYGRYKGIAGGGLLGDAEVEELQGIRAEVVLSCSIDPIACMLARKYRWAILYQFGILVLQEWLMSDRVNYFTLHSKEDAAAMMQQWETIELPRAMKTSTDQAVAFVASIDRQCVQCGSGPSYTQNHG